MKYRIEAIQTVKGTGLLYVDVAFLDDVEVVVHRNDFVMQIRPVQRAYIGREGEDGELIDKGEEYYQESATDVAAAIEENIWAYMDRIELGKVPKDRRNARIETEDTDPLGLRAMPGVVDLIGVINDHA